MTTLMHALEGFAVRNCTLDDAAAVADLINLCDAHDGAAPEESAENLRQEWEQPNWDFAKYTRIVHNAAGQAIAYADFYPRKPHYVHLWAFGRVHPEYRNRGLGTALLHWAEAEARELIPLAPPEARVSFKSSVLSTVEPAVKLLTDNGMSLYRSFYQMEIDFAEHGPVSVPPAPEGITIRTLADGIDPRAVHLAFEEAFSDHFGHLPGSYEHFEQFLLKSRHHDPTLWFLALDGDQIAGFVLAEDTSDEDPNLGWIDDLGVRRAWRKRGIGGYLLRLALAEIQRRGRARAALSVDTDSLTGALRLYENAGMRPTRRYDRYEKVLRPGVELSTQTVGE